MCKRTIILTLWALLLSLAASAAEPTRATYNLNDNWRFYYAADADATDARVVSLPHTWNSDVVEGDYERTAANYTRELYIPEVWRGKRLFLRFGAVQSVADVFVNGSYVGSHEGGFTAFTFEITDKVRFGADNYLRVVASNAMRSDVLPVSTDMNLAGGIYRDVDLLVTGENIISPLHHSSDGVYVVPQSVTEDVAKGVVRLYVSAPNLDHTSVMMRIVGGDGYEVDHHIIRNAKLVEGRPIELPFEFNNPQLWSPASPTLYTVEVTLGDARNPEDVVTLETGFRDISISDDNRLCINGVPIAVRGVNVAHDRGFKGVALSKADMDADLDIIADMGANALRSIYGPHNQHLYDRCDRDGLLVWVDVPFSRSPVSFSDICYYPSPAFRENGLKQLEEIVAQNMNHPSVVMWGLFEQVWQRGDDVVGYVRELNERAHSLDPSRPTVGLSGSDGEINFITDLIVFRQNVGYMKGSVEDVAVWCRQLSSNEAWSAMRYGVCYGEEGNTEHRTEKIERAQRGTRHHPERRQTYMHERYVDIINEADIFWGIWLSSMFDYASARRTEGLNQSGVVAHDHTTMKDAYYLYRTLWNDTKPTLYIKEHRWSERRNMAQTIDVYSSEGEPTVLVDGDTVRVRRVAEGHYRADSLMLQGRVVVTAIDPIGSKRDSVVLNVGRSTLLR